MLFLVHPTSRSLLDCVRPEATFKQTLSVWSLQVSPRCRCIPRNLVDSAHLGWLDPPSQVCGRAFSHIYTVATLASDHIRPIDGAVGLPVEVDWRAMLQQWRRPWDDSP
ncbi:hypothetical protein J6590_060955 [Homalodisca vitripennis]|nr:hypothetical protein J6590_060955 [Homalodisca vitripennis]